MQLLRESGLKALTGVQVAKAAGVLQSHLTYYFPKRPDLLVAVGRHSLTVILEQLRGFYGGAGSLLQDATARERVISMLRPLLEDQTRMWMMFGLFVEVEDDDELRKVLQENTGFLRGALALAMGRTMEDPDVEIVLAALWGLGVMQIVYGPERAKARNEVILKRLGAWLDAAPAPAR